MRAKDDFDKQLDALRQESKELQESAEVLFKTVTTKPPPDDPKGPSSEPPSV